MSTPDPSDHRPSLLDEARIRVAGELRRAADIVVGRQTSDSELHAIADALRPLLDALADAPPRVRESSIFDGGVGLTPPGDGEPFADSLWRPVSGSANPLSVPMTMYRSGDDVVSTVTLGSAFEGAPGRSHGGFVSAIFDDLLGNLPMLLGKIAFTASLTITYVAPSPVHEPVTYRGWVDRIEGKKIFVAGEAHHGDTLVSSATGLFIDATEALAALYGA